MIRNPVLIKFPDRNYLAEGFDIRTLSDIWKQAVYTKFSKKYTDEEFQEWIDAYLENLYPDLNKFEREYAFVQVYGFSSNTSSKGSKAQCPKCGSENADFITYYKSPELKEFSVDIGDYRVFYSIPTEVDEPGYPVSISELNEEVDTPRKGDIIVCNGKEEPWRPGIPKSSIEKVIRPVGDRISFTDLSEEEFNAINDALLDISADNRYKNFSASPVDGMIKVSCACGYEYQHKLSRAIDVIYYTSNPGTLNSINTTKATMKKMNYADHEDIDKMNIIDLTLFQQQIKKIEEAQK